MIHGDIQYNYLDIVLESDLQRTALSDEKGLMDRMFGS
jgi:hypothetical protein